MPRIYDLPRDWFKKEDTMTDFYDINTRNRGRERMGRFWECYVEGTNGGCHFRHLTLKSARQEAERLARLPNVQGKTVYLFECIGQCKLEPNPVKWKVPR